MSHSKLFVKFLLVLAAAAAVTPEPALAVAPVYSVRFYTPGVRASPALRFTDASGAYASPLKFPTTVESSSSAPVTFTAQNVSTAPVVFQATPFAVNAPFSILGTTCAGSLAPTKTCTITLKFSPPYYGVNSGNFLTINAVSVVTAPPLYAKASSLPYVQVVATGGFPFFKKSDGRWTCASYDFTDATGGDCAAMPAGIPEIFGATKMATSSGHSIALMPDGTIKVSGANYWGQLGLGDANSRSVFETVPGITGVKNVAAHYYLSYIQMSDGSWMSAGEGRYGALANGSYNSQATFTPIPGTAGSLDLQVIFSGVFIKKSDGLWYAAGRNVEGQLGLGTLAFTPSLMQVPGLALGTSLYPSVWATLAKDSANNWKYAGLNNYSVYTARNNYNFSGTTTGGWNTFVSAPALAGYVDAKTNNNGEHVFIQSNAGRWFTMGVNQDGELGLGDIVDRTAYTLNSDMDGSTVASAGNICTFIMKGGLLYGVGVSRAGIGLQSGNSSDVVTKFELITP